MNQKHKKGNRRKKQNKSTKRWELNRRWKYAFLLFGICMVAVVGCYRFFERYDGLGTEETIPVNQYNMEAVEVSGGRLSYEDDLYRSLQGIDVSSYQKKINWKKVKADGIDFAMIRLGYRGYREGELKLDSRFKENVKQAQKAGLDIGLYFFSQAITPKEAIEEAKFVVKHIDGADISYPIAFDMEYIHGADRINHLTIEEMTEIADAFCKTIAKKGYVPMIYGNPTWLTKHYDLRFLTEYQVWMAHYTEKTDYPYIFGIWQYSDKGKVDGIQGNVDMNLHLVLKN